MPANSRWDLIRRLRVNLLEYVEGGSTVSRSLTHQVVCYCAVLSVVRKMSEAEVHVRVEQHIIIKFLKKEGYKWSEFCSRLKSQYGEKTLSNVSVCKWSSAFKKWKGNGGE